MKTLSLNSRNIETLVYILIWALVFSVPYFNQRNLDHINWEMVKGNWIHLFGYLILFLVNVYILVPQLLLKKKYLYYFVGVVLIVVLIIGINITIQSGIPPKGAPEGFSPDFRPDMPMQGEKSPFMAFIDNFIICILIIGAGTTTKLLSKWLSEEKLRKDIEKEQLKTNLALLRHQVSPHFFMNTLNNIHALIDINSETAKDAVARLSTLMRYLLYDSAKGMIELKKEIEFINSFISLQQLRVWDDVTITVVIPEQIPNIQIPPMLFISLLENAFKHGVSYQSKSYIYFEIKIFEKSLLCNIKNSKHVKPEKQNEEYSGIGLDNIKKSLRLLYNDDYKLVISDKEKEFEVNLTIPL
jgi:hypothetical protein